VPSADLSGHPGKQWVIRVPWRLTSESAVVARFDEASNHWVGKDAADPRLSPITLERAAQIAREYGRK